MTGKTASFDDVRALGTLPAQDGGDAAETVPSSPWLTRAKRYAAPVFGLIVLGLLLSHAHEIDWSGAWKALQSYSAPVLLAAFGLAAASHVLYGCFDLIGRHHTHHGLPVWRTWAIAVSCYAFNLNLGSLVGGVALRARLYARAGLDPVTTAQVIGISMASNWLGYGLLAGALFAAGLIQLPDVAHVSSGTLRWIGGGMVLLVAGYVLACAVRHGRSWTVRGRTLQLPSPRLALVQLVLASTNWALMGAAMYVLLGQQVPYGTVLCVLMAAAVVGVVMPIPGGLGVLEAVYLALLSGSVPQSTVMGAVMAYRALYYLVPLASGLLLYTALERYATLHPAALARTSRIA